jgi:hypothetical protein
MPMHEQELQGGIANAGRVTRSGDVVLRPSGPYSGSIRTFLQSLRAAGFEGAPQPAGLAHDGRERFVFIEGEVGVPPYPDWTQSDSALASVAALMRRFHHASSQLDLHGAAWSSELADPAGGSSSVVCHNDVCLENVVFRDGEAVALLDFDFAAPGRTVYDLVQCARMCVPVDDDVSASRIGWQPADKPARLRLMADSYGLDESARPRLVDVLDQSIAQGGEFVRRRVEAGDPSFISMWNAMGGMERFDRRRRWWAASRQDFMAALR